MTGFADNPQFVLLTAGLLALFCIMGLGYALFSEEIAGAARKRQRLQQIDEKKGRGGRGSWSPIRFAEESARDRLRMLAEEQKKANSSARTLRSKLEQAGVKSSPAKVMILFYLGAAAVAAVVYAVFRDPAPAALAGVVAAFLGPRVVIGYMISHRLNKFLTMFPNAIDIMVRGVKSGLPVNESMKVAANEIPDPVGEEFRTILAQVNMGVSLEEALKQMNQRLQSPDVNFFRTVLAIQKQTGGNLAEALGNLSGILRDRRKMKLKIKALSSEARMSAIIIGSLPVLVTAALYFINPDYIMYMFEHPTGQMMLGVGIAMMFFGAMVMRSMVRFEI
ncbi:MAG: type II secretion system F family protein [Pseudomonadota bacterium]